MWFWRKALSERNDELEFGSDVAKSTALLLTAEPFAFLTATPSESKEPSLLIVSPMFWRAFRAAPREGRPLELVDETEELLLALAWRRGLTSSSSSEE